jgi:hypothetical protein
LIFTRRVGGVTLDLMLLLVVSPQATFLKSKNLFTFP